MAKTSARALRRRGEPGVERRRGLGGAALAGEEGVERLVRLRQGRGVGDHRAVAGLGGGGIAAQLVEPGAAAAGRRRSPDPWRSTPSR